MQPNHYPRTLCHYLLSGLCAVEMLATHYKPNFVLLENIFHHSFLLRCINFVGMTIV